MRAHDRRVEHLDQVRGRTHRGKRVEEGFEDASLAQSVETFPYAVPGTTAFRQGAPSNVLDREEMERLKEAPVIVALPSSPGKAGAKHRQRVRRKRDVTAAGHYAAIACEAARLHFHGSSSSIFVLG